MLLSLKPFFPAERGKIFADFSPFILGFTKSTFFKQEFLIWAVWTFLFLKPKNKNIQSK